VAKKSNRHSYAPELVALGEAIRAVRLEIGLSQEALALSAEIDRSYVGGIERGEHNLALVNILKLARCLGLSGEQLMRRAGL
jgi:transcriptional regulator with XRE-family HTH domain